MAQRIARVLSADPDLCFEFYVAASEIVDDFDDYGAAIQANEAGIYDEHTTIEKLRAARNAVIARLRTSG